MNTQIQIIQPDYGDGPTSEADLQTFWERVNADTNSVILVLVFGDIETQAVFSGLVGAMRYADGTGQPCVLCPKVIDAPGWGTVGPAA